MYLTKNELLSQNKALEKTFRYFLQKKEAISEFKEENKIDYLTFIGSGSSYYLGQSSEMSARIHLGLPSTALAAGDLILNFSHYQKILQKSLLVSLSRSGKTTEVVLAVKRSKEAYNTPFISVCASKGSELSKLADLSLEMPWSFDESVCQTRTVTNLYTAALLLLSLLGEQDGIIEEIEQAINLETEYIDNYKDPLREFVQDFSWNKVVVLADSELQGLGQVGALAFKEIAMVPSNYHHILDVRHGPMVLVDEDTLVIIAISPNKLSYQEDLVRDLKESGALVITVGEEQEETKGSDLHVVIPEFKNYGVRGIPFIFVPQSIAFYKAVQQGINPDQPRNLSPWINL
jgi:fructoselysine-6-P-deglycase FrlB-like protein